MISAMDWIIKTSYTQVFFRSYKTFPSLLTLMESQIFIFQCWSFVACLRHDQWASKATPVQKKVSHSCIHLLWQTGSKYANFFESARWGANFLNDCRIHVPDSVQGNINVQCTLFMVTADLPARGDFMNMKHFNDKCACHLCKSEGKGYGLNNIRRCWPFKQYLEKRTHEDQFTYASKATQKKAGMGVKKGHSIFAKLLFPFDLIRSI